MIVIACSGASHSGKTTFANIAKKLYPDKVIMQDEINLNVAYDTKRTKPIDDLRKNPFEYFEYEKAIIMKKILQEQTIDVLQEEYNDKIIIFERSLADSFYYITNFTDISKFDDNQVNEYNRFIDLLCNYAKLSYESIYDKVFIFEPVLFEKLDDERRAKNLKNDHYNEYKRIELINYGFAGIAKYSLDKIQNVNMGKIKFEYLEIYVNNILKEFGI